MKTDTSYWTRLKFINFLPLWREQSEERSLRLYYSTSLTLGLQFPLALPRRSLGYGYESGEMRTPVISTPNNSLNFRDYKAVTWILNWCTWRKPVRNCSSGTFTNNNQRHVT
ncbi:hypothetical protein E2C01_036683 [Portunus trituberculatus]|uniref:Uncharacterized protein n=1 Tax=Portunus trituberculatus TaxID=210409 RepID=A0A5B7FBV3_PORTR|nr:hypothetical protein [Portunus trituberculatus]